MKPWCIHTQSRRAATAAGIVLAAVAWLAPTTAAASVPGLAFCLGRCHRFVRTFAEAALLLPPAAPLSSGMTNPMGRLGGAGGAASSLPIESASSAMLRSSDIRVKVTSGSGLAFCPLQQFPLK
jgi:hypothetical protein